jgi:hypothetical protein
MLAGARVFSYDHAAERWLLAVEHGGIVYHNSRLNQKSGCTTERIC